MPNSSIRNTPRNHTFDIKLTKHIMCRRTRVCVCVCECTSICMYICVSVCIWMNECMCVSSYICLWMNMCAYMSMDPYAYVWAYICACMDAYTHLIKFNKHGQDLLTTKSIFWMEPILPNLTWSTTPGCRETNTPLLIWPKPTIAAAYGYNQAQMSVHICMYAHGGWCVWVVMYVCVYVCI